MRKSPREAFKVYKNVFDGFTIRILFKLISQGHFEGLVGPISIGKESNVFSAEQKDKTLVITKIYRLESCDFNRMYEYIRTDPRFMHIKRQRRKVIFAWAQREYRNLLIAREADIRVPLPITVMQNVLVLEFIGNQETGDAAPKLKDAYPDDPKAFMAILLEYVRRLYAVGYTHGDLSEYNILNSCESPVIIDVSGMCPKQDPMFEEYFTRDIKNLCRVAGKLGVKLREDAAKKFIEGKRKRKLF